MGEQIRTLFRLFVLFAVLVAVAMLSAITTIRLTIHSGQENMPNLIGTDIEAAQRKAGLLGIGVRVEDRLFSEKYAAHQIISQMPLAGTRVKSGQFVHVLVSLGPPRVSVPEMLGSSVRAAQISAVQRGLALGDVAAVHWAGAPVDQVVSQDPPPATTDVRSPVVNLLVSLGEPPAAFVCPNFVGMRIEEARRLITNAGFKEGRVTPVPTTGSPGGAASPAPPGAAETGSSASIPPGTGQTTTAAASPVPSGTILKQSPAPGSKIDAGASFDFDVAQ